MATGPRYSVKFKKRIKLLSSELPRLVVRKSNKYVIAQIITYNPKGDKTLVSVCSKQLNLSKNLKSAYKTGLLLGEKAVKNNINEAILDIGLNPAIKGSKLFAILKGALAKGLKVNHKPEVLPKINTEVNLGIKENGK